MQKRKKYARLIIIHLFVCFVLIWVSLYCRQAIQLRHYLPKVVSALPAAWHTSMPGLSTKSATVVTKLPLYGNLSLHLTQHQQVKPPFLGN